MRFRSGWCCVRRERQTGHVGPSLDEGTDRLAPKRRGLRGPALAPNPNPLSEAVVGKAQGNPVDGK